MNTEEIRALELLRALEGEEELTQRALSDRLGVALGLVNAFLKRLARKGLIKIATAPRHRIRYWLTPRGFAEKSRLTVEYLRYSFRFYRDARSRLRGALEAAARRGAKRAVLIGTGEMAELAYLALRESPLKLAAVAGSGGGRFLSHPVRALSELPQIQFDLAIAADPDEKGAAIASLKVQGRLVDPFGLQSAQTEVAGG